METGFQMCSTTLSTKIKIILKSITVEPMPILSLLYYIVSSITVQHLILEKGCRVNLELGEDICNALSLRNESFPGYKLYEQKVQTLATNMFVWRDIIIAASPPFLLIFIGYWSDKYKKRKQIILNSLLADIITIVLYLFCTYFFYSLPLEVTILAYALPQALTGGSMVAQVGIFSYISETTSESNRTTRLGIYHSALIATVCLGSFLNGILYQELKFYGVFGLCLILCGSAYLYGVIFVKDIWEYEANNGMVCTGNRCFLKDFFDFGNISKTFSVAFRKGENSDRKKIWLVLILSILSMGPWSGEFNVTYYYARYKFGWSPIEFSMFHTFHSVIHGIGILISLALFTKVFKVNDCYLGMFSFASRILGSLIFAFGPSSMYMYIGCILNIFNDVIMIVTKSILSKLVPREELGKLYAINSLAETLAPLIFCPIYSKIYANTMDAFPGTFYVVSAFSALPGIFILGWLHYQWTKEQQDHQCKEDKLLG